MLRFLDDNRHITNGDKCLTDKSKRIRFEKERQTAARRRSKREGNMGSMKIRSLA